MKHLFLPLLAILTSFSKVSCEEICLNVPETPARASVYYLDDMENLGEVSGPQKKIIRIDEQPFALQVGDLFTSSLSGRQRKGFLLFRLPPLEGKKPFRATLKLFLRNVVSAQKGHPLSSGWLFHAGDWPDDKWEPDAEWHGLQTSHFSDKGTFSEKIPLCQPGDKSGFIDLDVTKMILADYQRSGEPVAAFRIEISNTESFDVTDEHGNYYSFSGPRMSNNSDKAPALVLAFE